MNKKRREGFFVLTFLLSVVVFFVGLFGFCILDISTSILIDDLRISFSSDLWMVIWFRIVEVLMALGLASTVVHIAAWVCITIAYLLPPALFADEIAAHS